MKPSCHAFAFAFAVLAAVMLLELASVPASAQLLHLSSGSHRGVPCPTFDSHNFRRHSSINNQYSPFLPGTKFTYQGHSTSHAEYNIVNVTHDTKTILGI